MNTKRKSARNEHRSMALLEAAGYRCTRSRASLGEWDIVGIGTTDIALVQVRTRDWPSLLERAALTEFPGPAECAEAPPPLEATGALAGRAGAVREELEVHT